MQNPLVLALIATAMEAYPKSETKLGPTPYSDNIRRLPVGKRHLENESQNIAATSDAALLQI